MAKINLLDKSVIERIAAGEVVERPASVIKELVENSIDAGATAITIEIENGGIDGIRVTDNGSGIETDQLPMCFLSHATSKISTEDDLFSIRTMGFRGEAVSSIAAVSRTEILTRTADAETGARAVCEGGEYKGAEMFGCPDGTTVYVRDLFYNVPARRKFLKKPGIEAGYAGDMAARLILANGDIAIRFIQDGRTVYNSRGTGLKNAIFAVYGRECTEKVRELEYKTDDFSFSGFLGLPDIARANRSRQTFIVNGRYIRDHRLTMAVEKAYASRTMVGRFPFFVIKIDVPPEKLDVNVHPNKTEVRFQDEAAIIASLGYAAERALEQRPASDIPAERPAAPAAPQQPAEPPREAPREPAPFAQVPFAVHFDAQAKAAEDNGNVLRFTHNTGESNVRASLLPETDKDSGTAVRTGPLVLEDIIKPAPDEPGDNGMQPILGYSDRLEGLNIIGQAFDVYIIAEFGDDLYIIDQHAAHERLRYEQLLASIGTPVSQQLLFPVPVELTLTEKNWLDENINLFESLGFEAEPFGELAYQVRAVPLLPGEMDVKAFFTEALDRLSELDSLKIADLKREMLMRMACHSAVRGGDRLTMGEMSALLRYISSEDVPLSCPHGRPVAFRLSKKDIDKRFGRI